MKQPPEIAELLRRLEEMPAFLEERSRRFDGDAARRPGPEGGFSFVEEVWHLADLEREGYGLRITRLREEHEPRLPDFDGARVAHERRYRDRNVGQGLATFQAAREANLRLLAALSSAEWDRHGTQEHVGPLALRDLPAMMHAHDASHREEIEGLLGAAPVRPVTAPA